MDDITLTKQIKEIRMNLGISQEKFAHLIGVSVVTVNRWETGDNEPSPMALKLAQQLITKEPR